MQQLMPVAGSHRETLHVQQHGGSMRQPSQAAGQGRAALLPGWMQSHHMRLGLLCTHLLVNRWDEKIECWEGTAQHSMLGV
jgi:hypothetical protein